MGYTPLNGYSVTECYARLQICYVMACRGVHTRYKLPACGAKKYKNMQVYTLWVMTILRFRPEYHRYTIPINVGEFPNCKSRI